MSGLSQNTNNPLIIGRFGSVYGVKGWLKIHSYTRPSDNILLYAPWLLKLNDGWQEINIEESRTQGQKLFVKILGVNSPEKASEYVNCNIAINSEKLPKLKKDEYYWKDLVGLSVQNQSNLHLGAVSEIIETGANDVFVVKGSIKGNERILIPLIMDLYIKNIDLDNGVIHVDWIIEE